MGHTVRIGPVSALAKQLRGQFSAFWLKCIESKDHTASIELNRAAATTAYRIAHKAADALDSALAENAKLIASLESIECPGCEELERENERLKQRLREEIMESYNTLTTTRKARYSGPEEYADAVLAAESTVSNRQASPTERAVYTTSEQALLDRIERGEARERTQDDAVLEAIRTGQEQFVGHWMPTGHDIYLSVRQRRARV